ncbi:MAG: chemotaxis response regulator protein-glutamate methylesterase [Nitrosopumilaceae archaeon]|nr:chemotaxis response regulator protein-glutamate methylesterase [Nitrosopumilaceae archaeon]NDB87787.1 chemotaxis response regulator protein-glutamate methylesterase [Nitrososphaerota archaeon]NDB62719.1 chemotaxis response regulator protein-glutamate methylesterase [Nitrosopumilaceae archaeon]NDB90530.1 chemotaxis response regulator protein-glutamate methylesterase [Nitrososphaerota archaeon]NDF26586.1 chemotaxis response regulator protein-glutamate methylesterase [Nitrosopumilaceae archaeon
MSVAGSEKIKVLIINDSLTVRMILSEMVLANKNMHISGTARDGLEGLSKLKLEKPDVILVDLEMPNMDGLTFIQNAVAYDKTVPIIVTSSYSQEGSRVIFDALEAGALDFISLADSIVENKLHFQEELFSKIETASKSNPEVLIPEKILSIKPVKKTKGKAGTATKIIVIGASTGGPKTLCDIVSKLPGDLPAGLLIIQHMPSNFTTKFAQRLDEISEFSISEAKDGDAIQIGKGLLAPGDYHMEINSSQCVTLNKEHKRFGVRPAVNVSMITASEIYGENAVGVLLTGMGQDGAFGMKMIRKRGGQTIAQDEATSIVYGMPKAAKDLDAVDKILPLDKIPAEIVRMVTA